MDDLSSVLSGLLNSPEGMEKIKSMAAGLMGGASTAAALPPEPPANPIQSVMGDISPSEIAGMMKVVSALKSGASDSRTSLLMSLRPHLSAPRQKRVDEAVKILRLVSMLPIIKSAGII